MKIGHMVYILRIGQLIHNKGGNMRAKRVLIIIIAVMFSVAKPEAYINHRYHHLPDSVQTINNKKELEVFLNSTDEVYGEIHKIWGIKRLGQIGNEDDIPKLLKLYNDTPMRESHSVDGVCFGIKYFSLIAIGKIGGKSAEDELLKIGNEFGLAKSQDSSLVFSALCDALGEIGTFKARQKLEDVYSNENYGNLKRETALKNVYLIELGKDTYKNASDSVVFLFNKIDQNFSKNMLNLENFIITKAAQRAFLDICSQNIIDALQLKIARSQIEIDKNEFLESTLKTMNLWLESKNK